MNSDEIDSWFEDSRKALEPLAAQTRKTMSELKDAIESVAVAFSFKKEAMRQFAERLSLLTPPPTFPPVPVTKRPGRINPAPWTYQTARSVKPSRAKRSRHRIVRKINP
jgi:hypothetical protein